MISNNGFTPRSRTLPKGSVLTFGGGDTTPSPQFPLVIILPL